MASSSAGTFKQKTAGTVWIAAGDRAARANSPTPRGQIETHPPARLRRPMPATVVAVSARYPQEFVQMLPTQLNGGRCWLWMRLPG